MSETALTHTQDAWLRSYAARLDKPLYQDSVPSVAKQLEAAGLVRVVQLFEGSVNPKLKAGPLFEVHLTAKGKQYVNEDRA